MYSSDSLEILKEKLDYECFIIQESLEIIRLNKGTTNPLAIILYHDSEIRSLLIECGDILGSSYAESFINKFSPLLFCASYKILDMIMEWILERNKLKHNSTFKNKIKIINNSLSQIKLPDILDFNLFNVLFKLYDEFRELRNAITHGQWGENIGGDLHFNFNLENERIEIPIQLQQVLNFAEVNYLLSKELINPSNQKEYILISIKYLLNQLQSIHNLPLFENINEPVFYNVIYNKDISNLDDFSINLKKIRDSLFKNSNDYTYSYSLKVIINNKENNKILEWFIPDLNILPSDDYIDLNLESWNKYQIN